MYTVHENGTDRPATETEIAEIKAREAADKIEKEAAEEKAKLRAAAIAKLGLTEKEIAAVLG